MGLFGHGGGLSKLGHGIEHTVKKTGSVAHDVWTHGGREVLLGAGIVAGTIFTGGALAGAIAGTGAIAGGTAAMTAGAISGSLLAGGYAGYSSASEHHEAAKLAEQQAEEQRVIDAENAKAYAARRANLLSLRKQVGAVNVGAKSTVFSGGSTETKTTGTGVVLG